MLDFELLCREAQLTLLAPVGKDTDFEMLFGVEEIVIGNFVDSSAPDYVQTTRAKERDFV